MVKSLCLNGLFVGTVVDGELLVLDNFLRRLLGGDFDEAKELTFRFDVVVFLGVFDNASLGGGLISSLGRRHIYRWILWVLSVVFDLQVNLRLLEQRALSLQKELLEIGMDLLALSYHLLKVVILDWRQLNLWDWVSFAGVERILPDGELFFQWEVVGVMPSELLSYLVSQCRFLGRWFEVCWPLFVFDGGFLRVIKHLNSFLDFRVQ